MASLKRQIDQLEKEQRFQMWLQFDRFLESLNEQQLEEVIVNWQFPDPPPPPVPAGKSRLDGLGRKELIKLWEKSERENARLMHEMKDRTPDELRFYVHHDHWPEQECCMTKCRAIPNSAESRPVSSRLSESSMTHTDQEETLARFRK